MDNLLKTIIALAVLSSPSSGEDVVIDQAYCSTVGQTYGVPITCNTNEVIFGSCGSGRDPDCGGYYDYIQCCDVAAYAYDQAGCATYGATYGTVLSCPEITGDPARALESVCGSGENADCNGSYHEITCCPGTFSDGFTLYADTATCYWQWATYGYFLQCLNPTDAVYGRCGSGENPDCNGGADYAGIYCCKMQKL